VYHWVAAQSSFITVYVAGMHAHVQRPVSVVKMATALEEYTIDEQSSVVRFCGQTDAIRRIFIKKLFLFTMGNICRVKRFDLDGKRFADDEEVQTEVQKWLRQHSKYFYATGFNALVKRWDKCINVGEGYVEK
jgi:hypothetical protein